MGTVERRYREKQQMRRIILDAAMQLFVEEGFEKVSIRGIANKIEYSTGTIYLYFKDKDEIFYRLHEEGFHKFIERQGETLKIKDPLKRLNKQGEVYLNFALEEPEYYDLMFIMKGPIKKVKHDWEYGFKSYNILRETIAECIKAGAFNGNNVEVVSLAMWSYVHGLSSLIIRDRLKMIPKDKRSYLIKGVMAFLKKFYEGEK